MIGKGKYEKIKEIERISAGIIILKKNITLSKKDWSTCTCILASWVSDSLTTNVLFFNSLITL